jgi:hypothetical protein
LFAPAAKNITSANISHTPGTGVYCFQDLPLSQQSAIASSAGFFTGELDVVVNVSVTFSGLHRSCRLRHNRRVRTPVTDGVLGRPLATRLSLGAAFSRR